MGISIFKQSKGLKEHIDIQEAFNIWNALRTRYHSIETLQLLKNFVHDSDFVVVIDKFLVSWNGSQERYQKLSKKFQLKEPQRPPRDLNSSVTLNSVSDDMIYRRIYNDLTAELYFLATAYRSSTTNDNVRKFLRQDLISHLDDFEILYKYGKLKGWVDDPPAYKTSKPSLNEQLAVSEAFHLMDHVAQRYHQIQLTQLFLSFAHDKEFRLILSEGIKNLQKETTMLEDLALKFEVPLPKMPPTSVSAPIDPETVEDRFIFASILNGIQNATDLHIRAVVETIRNDALRKVIFELFSKELDMYEKLLKYGKMKGWIAKVPIYAEPV